MGIQLFRHFDYKNHSLEYENFSDAKSKYAALTDIGGDTRLNSDQMLHTWTAKALGAVLLHEYAHSKHSEIKRNQTDVAEGMGYAIEVYSLRKSGMSQRANMRTAGVLNHTYGAPGPEGHRAHVAQFARYSALLGELQLAADGRSSGLLGTLAKPMTEPTAKRYINEVIGRGTQQWSTGLRTVQDVVVDNLAAISLRNSDVMAVIDKFLHNWSSKRTSRKQVIGDVQSEIRKQIQAEKDGK